MGIAMYPQDGKDFDTLSRCADAAMYIAKQGGRNHYRFFTAEMQADSDRSLLLENALRRALERNQLYLHYQPQVCVASGAIVGPKPCCAGSTRSWAACRRPSSSRWPSPAA